MLENDLCSSFAAHDYKVISKIGTGGFSSVYLIYSLRYKLNFAAKVIPIKGFKHPFDHEIQALMGLNHPNIIKMYEHFQDDDNLFIVFDHCPNGSLMDLIDAHGCIQDPQRILAIFREICLALRHCHSRNIAHHDIKPANVLIDRYNRCVLADFGLSQIGTLTRDTMGSRVFMAPEQIKMEEQYDPMKADIWSLGVTLYMITFGDVPWPLTSIDDLDEAILNGKMSIPNGTKPEIAELITKMLNTDCNLRPTVDEILRNTDLMPSVPQVQKYGSGRNLRAMKGELVFGVKRTITNPEISKAIGAARLKSPLVSNKMFNGRRKHIMSPANISSLLLFDV